MNGNQSRAIFIFGCGYLGSHLAKVLIEQGYSVGALTRNKQTAQKLLAIGVQEVIVSQIESEDWHAMIKKDYTIILNCVSSAGGGIDGYRKSYLEGQRSVLNWLKGKVVETYIYTSSTSVYPSDLGEWVEESSETFNGTKCPASILVESEKAILENSSLFKNYFILRLSGIYGPGRHYLLDQLNRGEVIAGSGSYYLNMIYLEDIVHILRELMFGNRSMPSGTYNLSDDEPVTKQELADWLGRKLNIGSPTFDSQKLSKRHLIRNSKPKNRRISNQKLRAYLNLKYPSFREGYQAILGD
jgi:nucleoside-diphosphate-sugar epimerase